MADPVPAPAPAADPITWLENHKDLLVTVLGIALPFVGSLFHVQINSQVVIADLLSVISFLVAHHGGKALVTYFQAQAAARYLIAQLPPQAPLAQVASVLDK